MLHDIRCLFDNKFFPLWWKEHTQTQPLPLDRWTKSVHSAYKQPPPKLEKQALASDTRIAGFGVGTRVVFDFSLISFLFISYVRLSFRFLLSRVNQSAKIFWHFVYLCQSFARYTFSEILIVECSKQAPECSGSVELSLCHMVLMFGLFHTVAVVVAY